MLKKMKTNEGIQYKKLSPEEMKARGILGRLVGPCADFINPTRNGRKYSEQLWENVFNNPIMQEKIRNGVCFGELGHPENRTEIDMEKIAVCLREQPVKNEKGQLCAVFDILDTPNGRILKTLCDYGSTIGVSSRGQGDIITDMNGDEAVDPDTYECECWDVVLVPAVESARMQYVREGLDTNKIKMKKALKESLANASDEGRKVMEETLKELNIKLDEATQDNTNTQDSDAEYNKAADEFIDTVKEMNLEDANNWYFNEYEFDKKAPEDEAETKIANALKNRITELGGTVTESINEADDETEETTDDAETAPVEDDVITTDDVTTTEDTINFTDETALVPTEDETPVDNPEVVTDDTIEVTDIADENTEPEKTDEEIFFDYLKNNFDEKQIKKACKALDIELPEDDSSDDKADDENTDETSTDETTDDKSDDESTEDSTESTDDSDADTKADESEETNEECNNESCTDKKEEANEVVDESASAIDNGDAALLKSLQEALKGKSDLEGSVKSLQEKLAVSDTKVNELIEENNNYKKAIARLATMSKSNKDLKESVTKLEESLKEKDNEINEQKTRIARLVKSRKESVCESASLNESVQNKTQEVSTLKESLTKANDDVKVLNEQLSTLRKDSEKNISELNENLNKATTLKEAYKKLANKAVNKYIDIKAATLGLTSNDIKRKLGESYTLDDVDQVCEDLKAYQLNVCKLPFSIDRKVAVKVNESASKKMSSSKIDDDDDVDDSLINLAKSTGVRF